MRAFLVMISFCIAFRIFIFIFIRLQLLTYIIYFVVLITIFKFPFNTFYSDVVYVRSCRPQLLLLVYFARAHVRQYVIDMFIGFR